MRNPLLMSVQQKLHLWSGRSVGSASQWADTVPSPRAAEAGDSASAEPGADSQYLTGFDSQFVDDPAALDSVPAADAAALGPQAQTVAAQPIWRTPAPVSQRPAPAAALAPAPAAALAPAPAPAPAQPPTANQAEVPAAPAPQQAVAARTEPPTNRPSAAPAAAAVPVSAPAARHDPSAPAFIGSYAIQGRLRPGPLGQVYEAWDEAHARQVMVKVVQLQLEPDVKDLLDPRMAADVRARLDQHVLARARATVGLSHPHIATVLDAGLSAAGVYLVTERLKGRDMRDALERGWRPRPSLAALIVRRLAEALAHAHAHGLVHGDVKPANIFLDDMARPKLLDFGIAQVAYSRGIDHGQTPLNSLQYLAPEQLMTGKADARTDIRAAGLVLYELLAMRPPFIGRTARDVTRAVLDNQPIPLDELRSNMPRTLVGIAMRAMATEPDRRFASAAEMAAQLADWADKHAARKVRMQLAGRGNKPRKPSRLRRLPGARYVVLLSAMALAGVALVWQLLPNARQWYTPLAQATPLGSTVSRAEPAASVPMAATGATAAADAKPDGPTAEALQLRDQAYAAKRVGLVALDVSPVAQVFVNGVATGTTPPMTLLKLPVGRQSIVLRSEGFDAYALTVFVRHDQPVELRHQFTK